MCLPNLFEGKGMKYCLYGLLLGYLLGMMLDKAFGATTGTLNLKGTVPSILSLEISPETVATALPLDTTQTNTKIASVTERSNNKDGYKVTVTSTNQGKLVLDSENYIPYSLTYDNSPVNLAETAEFNNSFTNAGPQEKDVKISYTGAEHSARIAGDYTDTITFTIVAN
jgi:hypothetical protein